MSLPPAETSFVMMDESERLQNQTTPGEFRMEELKLRPLPQLPYEAVYAVLMNYDIDDARKIVAKRAWTNATSFLNPHATHTLNLVHFAACRGSLRILQQAVDCNAQLYATDEYGRCALHHAAHHGHVDILERLGQLAPTTDQPWELELAAHPQLSLADSNGRTALHYAVMSKHVEVVRLLVNATADVNARDTQDMTPFLLARLNVDQNQPEQMRRYEDIVDILVTADAHRTHPSIDHDTVLHHAVRLNSRLATQQLLACDIRPNFREGVKQMTPVHLAAGLGHHQTLSILLTDLQFSDVDATDKYGWSPLHHAAALGTLDCVRVLVNHGGNLAKETPTGDTVIDVLSMFKYDADLIGFFTDVLDTMICSFESMCNPVQIRHEITVNFQMLVPRGQPQMAVVSALIKSEQIRILQHPVLMTYIHTKWSRVRYFFYSLVFIHVIFALFLTVYTIVLLHTEDDCVYLRRMLLFTACIPFCHKVLYFMAEPKRYVKQFANWLNLICLAISIGTTIAGEFNPNKVMEEQPEEKDGHWCPSWIMLSLSIAILLAWIKIMLLAGQFPGWGFYALIFSTVLRNVLKVLFIGIWIIAGFSLCFAVLFHGHDQFANPLKAFVKTVLMFTGEYDFDNIFSINDRNVSSHNYDPHEHRNTILPITSRIVLLLFVMLASIVLMNLMIGLAVSDIQELVKEGQFSRLLKQAKFIAHCEQLTSHRVFRSWLVPTWLSDMMKSTIDIKKTIRRHWGEKGQADVSEEMWKDLLKLSSKNRKRDHKLDQSMYKPTNVKTEYTDPVVCFRPRHRLRSRTATSTSIHHVNVENRASDYIYDDVYNHRYYNETLADSNSINEDILSSRSHIETLADSDSIYADILNFKNNIDHETLADSDSIYADILNFKNNIDHETRADSDNNSIESVNVPTSEPTTFGTDRRRERRERPRIDTPEPE